MDRSKPILIAGVDITQDFTAEDIMDLFKKGKLRTICEKGYCTQGTMEGTLQFVPYWESVSWRQPKTYTSDDFVDVMREDVETQHPILRRTPQERTAAMAMRIVGEIKRTGRVGGLSDDDVKHMTKESWKEGQPLTAEDARTIAQTLLEHAEVDNEESESHRVTRDFRVS
jgi:hypothetical protein